MGVQTGYFPLNKRAHEFLKRFFPGVSFAEWNSWHWQLRHRICNVSELARILELSESERKDIETAIHRFPMSITPYYAALLNVKDPLDPIRKTVVPSLNELSGSPEESEDPLNEESDSPVPGIIHRYPDRVVLLATRFCSTYCRYCNRSRFVGRKKARSPITLKWQQSIDYIKTTHEVRDVLISGGDPLTLSDQALEWLLARLRCIPHVEIIRIGTKVPVVLPQRITPDLVRILRKYHPLWMSLHFTHPKELTPEVATACSRLADAGIPLGSQTVLLKGVNDDVTTMKSLFQGLLKLRVRPYCLYQCDPVKGSEQFRTTVTKGLEIIRGLWGHTSGYAIPIYTIDAPGGGGKIPLFPSYIVGVEGNDMLLANWEGKLYRYPRAF